MGNLSYTSGCPLSGDICVCEAKDKHRCFPRHSRTWRWYSDNAQIAIQLLWIACTTCFLPVWEPRHEIQI